MYKHWQFYQDHEEEIKIFLKEHKVLFPDSGVIRRWNPELQKDFEALGHTSLDFFQCKCNPFPGERYDANREVSAQHCQRMIDANKEEKHV